ncbi:MAG: hypothetical protein QOF77_2351 [Solirubrobacteraceae bacterium]|jgi:hypothetical protein|nr:hypothetical protein [Solirubrobacteraceae bacterium]
MAVREHWQSLPRAQRQRVVDLASRSRLRPASLSAAERAELRGLLAELQLPILGRRLAGIAVAKRRQSGRRGR